MVSLDIVESCSYRFELESHQGGVRFTTVRLDGFDVTEQDREGVLNCLNDLGKWEAVTKAFSDIVGTTGLLNSTQADPSRPGAYTFEMKLEEDRVKGFVSLSKEERHRRNGSALTSEEVVQQLKNVDKWRNLQRAISSLRAA